MTTSNDRDVVSKGVKLFAGGFLLVFIGVILYILLAVFIGDAFAFAFAGLMVFVGLGMLVVGIIMALIGLLH